MTFLAVKLWAGLLNNFCIKLHNADDPIQVIIPGRFITVSDLFHFVIWYIVITKILITAALQSRYNLGIFIKRVQINFIQCLMSCYAIAEKELTLKQPETVQHLVLQTVICSGPGQI